MRKIFYLSSILFLTSIIISCNKDITPEKYVEPELTISNHSISINEAIGYLEFALSKQTKVGYAPEIKDISVITSSGAVTTRSSTSSEDTLLYLINYKDDMGYALLSADKRIPEKILIFAEEGNLNPAIFNNNRNIIEPIPLISFYDSTYVDHAIGGTSENPQEFILTAALEYAQLHAMHYTEPGDITDIHINPEDNTGTMIYPKYSHQYYQDAVPQLMKTRWSQSSPYDDFVPNGKAAGCVPIALGQIMAYNEYPQNLEFNGIAINWDSLNSGPYILPNTAAAVMVAQLIYSIQYMCGSWRFNGGTFTFPYRAANFLSDMGYLNVDKSNEYNESDVIDMLEDEKPVFVAGVNELNITTSHGWVVDGYKKLIRESDYYDYATDRYLYTRSEVIGYYMNCNWGDGSVSSVASGLFTWNNTEYNNLFRTITYDVPNISSNI